MTRLLVAALQLAGIRSGRHASGRVNPVVALVLNAVGIATLSGLAVYAAFHIAAFQEVAR